MLASSEFNHRCQLMLYRMHRHERAAAVPLLVSAITISNDKFTNNKLRIPYFEEKKDDGIPLCLSGIPF